MRPLTEIAICIGAVAFFSGEWAQAALEDIEIGAEIVDSDDVSIAQFNLQGRFDFSGWDSNLSISKIDYELDYEPAEFDFQGSAEHLDEASESIQLNVRRAIGESFWLIGGSGYYEGFTNYRSIWLDEYFRQQFSDLPPEVPGSELYQPADPKGYNVSIGGRWEYRKANGFAQLSLSYLSDDVSPGYEIDFDGLERGALGLDTTAVSLSTENVLTSRIRSLIELRASKTTDRSWRYGAQVSANVSLAERWIARLKVGASEEAPQFESFYGDLAFEYQAADRLAIYVDGRYYDDTGEVEDALLFSSAAPGLTSRKFGLGARWLGENWSFKAYVAQLDSEYEPINPNTDFFQNLYQDRDWTVAQIAFGRSF